MTLNTLNRFARKINMPINYANIVVGLLIGVLHVVIPIPTLGGLILGCVMAVAGSISIAISNYFTAQKSAPEKTTGKAPTQRKDTQKSNTFLAIALPCMLLNVGACFFGMYTGTMLLIDAMHWSLAPSVVSATSIGLGALLATGTLINSWLQTHAIWESLKEPVKVEKVISASTVRLIKKELGVNPPAVKPTLKRSYSDSLLCTRSLDARFGCVRGERKIHPDAPKACIQATFFFFLLLVGGVVQRLLLS